MKREEDILLAACHKWLWNTYPEFQYCMWHVANERETNPISGAILRAKGVVRGAPDYVFNHKGRAYYFEFKSKDGTLSPDQVKVISALRTQGFDFYEIRDKEHFMEIIKTIID